MPFEEEACEFIDLIGSCGIDDFGTFEVVAFCVDLFCVTKDYQIRNALFQGFFCSGQDTIVVAFGQNDSLFVGFGAFNHRIDERGHKHSFHG